MDFENYCKMLESDLNEKWKEIHILEDKLSSLEEIIRSANLSISIVMRNMDMIIMNILLSFGSRFRMVGIRWK